MGSTIALGNNPARIVSEWNDTRLRFLLILTPYRLSYSYEYVTSYFSFRAKEQLTYSYEYNNWLVLVGIRGPIAGYRGRANQTCSKWRRSSLRWPLNAKSAIKLAGDLRKQILIVFRWCNRDNYCTHMSAIAPFWPFLSILTSFSMMSSRGSRQRYCLIQVGMAKDMFLLTHMNISFWGGQEIHCQGALCTPESYRTHMSTLAKW